MEIKDILSPDCTLCAVPGTSKKRILEQISALTAESLQDISQNDVLTALMCREKMGSTGIGNGIALPHGRIDGLSKTTAAVITCTPAVPFDAIDNQDVDVFFAIFIPSEQTEGHLQTLAMIAQKLSDKDTVKALRRAKDNQSLYELLT
ncbi:MAG: PTS IIA-like nitrogen regulatory protein PtsN [Aestuariibacter sp.]